MDDKSQARELLHFQVFYSTRQIKATWALAIVIAIMFFLEQIFGGSTTLSTLVKMGANVKELVRDGQYFRLLTSVFLHAGWLHVIVNTYVLFALGGFFNRILGDSKFLALFLFSGICGSIFSTLLGKASVSVGASGALWGLFGASVVIAYFKSSLIPEAVRQNLRRVTLINLVLNLGVSFLPMVDLWAHLGGGIGGFLFGLLLIIEPNSLNIAKIKNYIFMGLAIFLCLLYSTGFARMFIIDKPWEQRIKSPLTKITLQDVPFVISMPSSLVENREPNNNSNKASYVFGDIKYDAIILELHFMLAPSVSKMGSDNWLALQKDKLLADASTSNEIRKSVDLRSFDQKSLLYFEVPIAKELSSFNYVVVRDDYVIKLDFITHQGTKQQEIEELAKKIISSITNK